MITAVIVAWILSNIAIAGWLILVRVVLPDRERQFIGGGVAAR